MVGESKRWESLSSRAEVASVGTTSPTEDSMRRDSPGESSSIGTLVTSVDVAKWTRRPGSYGKAASRGGLNENPACRGVLYRDGW